MSYLLASEARTSEAFGVIITITHSRVEMGHDCHGFVSGLPRTSSGYDAIWVIVDKLTKTAVTTQTQGYMTGTKGMGRHKVTDSQSKPYQFKII